MFSIEPEGRVYVKGYGFLSFAKTMNNRYSKKLLDSVKKSADAIKTTSKRAIQETVDETDDLFGYKIANEVTSASKKLHLNIDENEIEIPKERSVSSEKRQKIIDDIKLA